MRLVKPYFSMQSGTTPFAPMFIVPSFQGVTPVTPCLLHYVVLVLDFLFFCDWCTELPISTYHHPLSETP